MTARYAIPESGPTAFAVIMVRVATYYWWLWGTLIASALMIGILARELRPLFLAALIAPVLVLLMGIAMHESAHLLTFRRLSGRRSSGRLVLSLSGAGIERPRLAGRVEDAMVSLAGPAFPGATGAVLVALGEAEHAPLVALGGALLAAHLLCLAPWWSDGRAGVKALFSSDS